MCIRKAKETLLRKINECADFDLFRLHGKIQMEKKKKTLISSSCSYINLQSKIPRLILIQICTHLRGGENEIPLTILFHFYFQEFSVRRDPGSGEFHTDAQQGFCKCSENLFFSSSHYRTQCSLLQTVFFRLS